MNPSITINKKTIRSNSSAYIVAELSANHNQRFENALALIQKAKEAGADAVKLQTYTPDSITIDCDSPMFRHGRDSLWAGTTLYELYSGAYTPWEWHAELQARARELEIDFFSTPFDQTALDFLEKLEVPAYKIASFEIIDIPLIRLVAQTGKPIIMSTGMATLAEIDEAVRAVRETGNQELALLKCTSAYPAPPQEMNLQTIPHMAKTFNVPVGLSDHTLETTLPVAALALGACIIEKHFTLSRSLPSPDARFSLEPHEFKQMVDSVRTAEQALGTVFYGASPYESASRTLRRSIFVIKDVQAGELLSAESVRSIRPGQGLHPRYLYEVLGRPAARDIQRGTPLSWDMVGGSTSDLEEPQDP